ncbi:unnamed protein product [Caenorhabditis angaria]|uniref:Uncharacterized protein n=1 Tax=Caenorhabditis angaria TaxID=860376 RepID=A0A9P1IJ48_9PELO|nr:unnamed protein product [Caenorhabditis angaria]
MIKNRESYKILQKVNFESSKTSNNFWTNFKFKNVWIPNRAMIYEQKEISKISWISFKSCLKRNLINPSKGELWKFKNIQDAAATFGQSPKIPGFQVEPS